MHIVHISIVYFFFLSFLGDRPWIQNVADPRRNIHIGKVLKLRELHFRPAITTICNAFAALELFFHVSTEVAIAGGTIFWILGTPFIRWVTVCWCLSLFPYAETNPLTGLILGGKHCSRHLMPSGMHMSAYMFICTSHVYQLLWIFCLHYQGWAAWMYRSIWGGLLHPNGILDFKRH